MINIDWRPLAAAAGQPEQTMQPRSLNIIAPRMRLSVRSVLLQIKQRLFGFPSAHGAWVAMTRCILYTIRLQRQGEALLTRL
jgi:hypothetical protein